MGLGEIEISNLNLNFLNLKTMILYINRKENDFSFTENVNDADYQVIISRLKNENTRINKKIGNLSYKEIPISSKESKELTSFISEHCKNVIQELNSLIEQ